MIKNIYKRRKLVASFFLSLLGFQLVFPVATYALTSGPSQPEVQSFQAASASNMVDLFSGDFSYNIPLFELPGPNGGYPFNLAYQSGVGMDQEASWVGLGWNLNPGAINRHMRGLPDEFNGDVIRTKMSIKPTVTVGVGAGVGLEVFGASKGASLTVGFSVYNNNYKGVGYSIDGSIGYSKTEGSMAGTGVNLGVSLDSKEGASVSPSLTLGTKLGEFGLGVGYNSKSGLSTVTMSHDYVGYTKSGEVENRRTGEKKKFSSSNSIHQSATISLAHPGYTPQISMPMSSSNVTARFKAGGAWWGIFASPYVMGFYNEQHLKHNKKWVSNPAYGYLNYQDASESSSVLDFNREKDGVVSKESPNLAIPSLSYDIYSVQGQGISAMYRPMRNDYGHVYDAETKSSSNGGSAGVDIGPAAHVGINLSINHSKSVSGEWKDNNSMGQSMTFKKGETDKPFEPWHFKVHGEMTSEDMEGINRLGGDKAVRIRLDDPNHSPTAAAALESTNKVTNLPVGLPDVKPDRKQRNQVIQPITNQQLLKNGEEMISTYKVKYLDENGAEKQYVRNWPAHHTAGFTALTPEGVRYVYGIPAYNFTQEEVTFSSARPESSDRTHRSKVFRDADDGDPDFERYDYTDKFLRRIATPKFAHSFLLTAIVGADYVDVKGDGVTEDDLGYWVKFTYQRKASEGAPYKWRDPYFGAHYQDGWSTDPRDDKASYTYGEKEIWYLARAETKSHIAEFHLKSRSDAFGAAKKLQDTNALGKASQGLDYIVLYTRSAGSSNPIKTVRFEHDYSLCKKVENSSNNSGKLTLKKVWFEFGASKRGSLNPYEFKYHANNPDYDVNAYDRWGSFKPYPESDFLANHDFPYVDQSVPKEQHDYNAAAWSLTEIKLPSGANIIVDYEADDYGYVQHKPAMQMMQLVNTNGSGASIPGGEYQLSGDARIRFKLENEIPAAQVTNPRAEVLKYLDQQRKNVFFKIKINLRSPSENFHEFISGYADIDFTKDMILEEGSRAGYYAYGSFYLKKEEGFHPFSMRVFQHLRTNQPELANAGNKLKETSNSKERVKQIKGMSGIVADIRKMFEGYYNYCNGRKWGRELTEGKAWIRLNSPDKIKVGGGLRVRQITMKDNSIHDEEGIYGSLYEYIIDENGKSISSGVAAYEPLIGGEENPLRYAKKYTQSIPLRSDNNLYFEYPINETYYPGPGVGYRKVTVTSLAAASLAGKTVKNVTLSDGKNLFPSQSGVSYGTTGATVHEFYTAKDFPVITDETEKKNRPYKLPVMIPFVGSIVVNKLSTTQGYSIVTNDMHGKMKKLSHYRQDKTGVIEKEPISWVKYNYAAEQRFYDQEKVLSVMNQFKQNDDGTLTLLKPDEMNNSSIRRFTVGQENEFFADMRQFEDKAWTGGVNFNTEFLFVLFGTIPVPVPWPSISKTSTQLRTAVTNKVIFKSGILESTEAFDGSAIVKTNNIKWDKLTGATVLTSVNNNFDNLIYTYSIPAYTQYQGMGAAFQNTGLEFKIDNVVQDTYKKTQYYFNAGLSDELLVRGDEILLYEPEGTSPVARAVYTGDNDGSRVLFSDDGLTLPAYRGRIVRSGYRNQINIIAGTIIGLKDPSIVDDEVTFEKLITVPQ